MSRPYLSYYPVIQSGNDFIVVAPGPPVLEIADEVDLYDGPQRTEIKQLWVTAVDSFPANDAPEGFYQEVGYSNLDQFIRALSRAHKTVYGEDVQVSVYRLSRDSLDALEALGQKEDAIENLLDGPYLGWPASVAFEKGEAVRVVDDPHHGRTGQSGEVAYVTLFEENVDVQFPDGVFIMYHQSQIERL